MFLLQYVESHHETVFIKSSSVAKFTARDCFKRLRYEDPI